ncbi:hypothetical protein BKA93DRAFT_821670 [Sparassis latifolia]
MLRNPAAMQNGLSTHHDTVAQIKEAAKEQAQKVRGASAISLLKSARGQIQLAQALERDGNLKGALSALTKSAALAQMFMDSAEFKQEAQPGKMGVLVKDFLDFQNHEGQDLTGKIQAVETKLLDGERSSSQVDDAESDVEPAQRTGGSIADRMRALQTAGLSVSSTKRLSRELSPAPSPLSPDMARPNRASLQSLSSQLASLPSLTTSSLSPVAASSSAASAASPHALVPTSSLGPPSPPSSTSSSPRLSHFNLAEFASQFPSIDELDEMDGLKLPSVPTGTGSASSRASSKHSDPDLRGERSLFSPPRAFPLLPMDPGPRPSSTPIPPTIDTFISRPASPAPSWSPRSPPSVPRKPSGLALGGRSPVMGPTTPPTAERSETPISTLFPKTLLELNAKPNYKVLVLDVRTRAEFEQEHVKVDAVVCIEPSVLLRDGITAKGIEDSLTVAPRHEWALFSNRDKFDFVAVYDDKSETFGPPSSPLSIFVRAIYEVAFSKYLKHPPMLLVGGLHAWKREFGDRELIQGASGSSSVARSVSGMPNGLASPSANGVIAPVPSLAESLPPTLSHTRLPAESTSTTISATANHDMDSVSFGRHRSGTEPSPSYERYPHRPWIPSQPNGRPADQDMVPLSPTTDSARRLVRKPAMSRPSSSSISFPHTPSIPENTTTPYTSPLLNGSSPITYPQFARHISPQISGSSFSSSTGLNGLVSMPPQASINPSPLSRRRSDYIDQSQEALSGLTKRPSIDYPDLSGHNILRPPPAAASSSLERHDNRPRLIQQPYTIPHKGPKPPTIQSDYPVTYWADIQIGTSGLKNLGNTCYMNSTIQCLSATVPFARFFTGAWKSAVNMMNPLGTKGNLAQAFANILRDMWQGEMQWLSPVTFRRSICMYASQFGGTEQHDSQEFLSFLLDGLHEDLNRVLKKPQIDSTPEREAELEKMPTQVASEQEWQIYRMRNDSLIVDFFQGQFRNRMECLTCHKTSTTYNAFMYLTLPIPSGRITRVTLHQCLEAFVKEEVMEKSEAWHCPHCKELRKATKRLSLSRLPPVLLIHLKRFSVKGPFTDKIETFVDFPLRGLDLTNYMPAPLPPGVSGGSQVPRDDPRSQLPPYRYDLYGVTNHFGTLSSGHYTAFIASRGGWLYCDDSRVSQSDAKNVVGKPAYILFYKRIKA